MLLSPAHPLTESILSPGLSAAGEKASARGHGLLTRAVAAVKEARQRHAERELARFIASHGGELTDDLEREISRRFGCPVGEVR